MNGDEYLEFTSPFPNEPNMSVVVNILPCILILLIIFIAYKLLRGGSTEKDKYVDQNPPSMEELGRGTWALLHQLPGRYPEYPSNVDKQSIESFIDTLSKYYPCEVCGEHLKTFKRENPPQLDSRHNLQQWFCKLHNSVNAKLGKKFYNCNLLDNRSYGGCTNNQKCKK